MLRGLTELNNMRKARTWGEFYSKPASRFLCIKNIVIHLRYLCAIILRRPRRILEIGVGLGIQSIFLSHFIKNVIALDSDKQVIMNAKTSIKRSKAEVGLVLTDAFSIPFSDRSFDVCYSQGFLEHFTDEEIIRLFKEQLRVAESFVHSMPSDHYPWRQFGNERHLTPRAWHNLLSKSLDGNADLTIKVKYGYLPLISWFIIIEVKSKLVKSDA
jgi:ubiquinone/menaquinone biosynthesis C-methylase UbiE